MKKVIIEYFLIVFALVAISFGFSGSTVVGLMKPETASVFIFPIYMILMPLVFLIYSARIGRMSSESKVIRAIVFVTLFLVQFIVLALIISS